MWKRSFTFLVVLVLAASSLWCYPSWVYGKTKTAEVTAAAETLDPEAEAAQEPSSEPSSEATAAEAAETATTQPASDTTQEAPGTVSTQGSESLSETLKTQGTELVDSLKDSKVKTAAVTQVSDYIDNAVFGVEVMEIAYNAEVAAHEDTEREYNKLAAKKFEKNFYTTINPYAAFSIKDQSWGIGLNTIYSYKRIGITLGVYKPSVDFKTWDDLTVTAGFSYTF